MNTVYDLCLEPLEERYTVQWFNWFEPVLSKYFYYRKIKGVALTNEVRTGKFLDVNSTVHWKVEQIKTLSILFDNKQIKDGDVFFVADFWFPLELLRYLADLNGVTVKIYAFLHAGTYTKEDFAAKLSWWGRKQEYAWAKMLNGIFVGSEYHKKSFIEKVVPSADEDVKKKIYVTGNPFYSRQVEYYKREKKDIVIFPNRFDMEKRPLLFLQLATKLKRSFPHWTFLITTSRKKLTNNTYLLREAERAEERGIVEIMTGIPKSLYYQLLNQSKISISTTIEENFGYCIQEGICADVVTIAPNDFSHPELLPKRFLYNDVEGLENLTEKYIKKFDRGYTFESPESRKKRFENSIEEMAKIMSR